MDEAALERYRERALAVLESAPPTSTAETRTALVDPLLSALDWDVRGPTCRVDVTIRETPVEYMLSVTSSEAAPGGDALATPALFVAVEPADASLRSSRADRLREAMAATGVDRTIYTTGRRWALLAGPTGDDQLAFDVGEVRERARALAAFARPAAERRLGRHARELAARRLAVERAPLADAVADELAGVAGDPYRRECRTAAAEFLDDLVRTFATGGPGGGPGSVGSIDGGNADARSVAGRDGPDTGDDGEASAEELTYEGPAGDVDTPFEVDAGPATGDGDDDALEAAIDPDGDPSPGERAEGRSDSDASAASDGTVASGPEGEYVVRFFDDRASVGAIGHSTPADALVETAEYLFERGLSGVRLPWSPGDDDDPTETVLNDEPTAADGSRMAASRQLSNGVYLNTAGDPETVATRVEALADRAGFRAMLTGDWNECDEE